MIVNVSGILSQILIYATKNAVMIGNKTQDKETVLFGLRMRCTVYPNTRRNTSRLVRVHMAGIAGEIFGICPRGNKLIDRRREGVSGPGGPERMIPGLWVNEDCMMDNIVADFYKPMSLIPNNNLDFGKPIDIRL
jgi:hypothetical protein